MVRGDRDRSGVEKALQVLLRVFGLFCAIAFLAVVMPRSWMAACHQLLGLGEFPQQPIAEYLARVTSAVTTLYGGFLLALSTDVRRYAPVITYQACALITLSVIGLIVLPFSGMPLWWLLADGAGAIGTCAAILWLQKAITTEG